MVNVFHFCSIPYELLIPWCKLKHHLSFGHYVNASKCQMKEILGPNGGSWNNTLERWHFYGIEIGLKRWPGFSIDDDFQKVFICDSWHGLVKLRKEDKPWFMFDLLLSMGSWNLVIIHNIPFSFTHLSCLFFPFRIFWRPLFPLISW